MRTSLAMFTEAIYKLKFKNTDDYFTRMLILEFILRYNNYHKNDGINVHEIR